MRSLLRPVPSWPPPVAAPSPPARGVRVPHGLVVFLLVFTGGFLAGLTSTTLGWLAIALGYAVVRLLGRELAVGGWREWLAALGKYATVAALVFALMTAGTAATTPPTKAEPKPTARPKAEATQADPWGDLGAQVAKLRERLGKGLPRVEVTTTKEGR